MQLKVGSNISSNKVVLVYMATPDKPSVIPSYVIQKENADEFVQKYNKQPQKLKKFSVITTLSTTLVGVIAGIKKKNLLNGIIFSIIGMLTGIILSAAFSHNKKDKLMDEYGVKKYSR